MANQVLYGFRNLKDQFGERVTSINGEVVTTAIAESVAEHNRQMDALIAMFCTRTEKSTIRYQQLGAARLQPLDANGRARPIKPAGYYDLGFPIRDAGSAWGANFKTKEKMTVEDANRITALMNNADKVWLRDQILAAIFASATYDYIDPADGTVTVQPLANGDTVTYQRNGSTAMSADTHQLANASAIADANDPVETIVNELTEHPENQGDVVIMIPTNLKSAVTGLTGFHYNVDPNLQAGANTAQVVGSLGIATPGQVLGYHDDKAWIVEWKALPDNYMVATTTAAASPLAMREEPEASLKGFIQIPDPRNDHPYYEQQYVRYAGFGAWNRVGAVTYLSGTGSYSVPTGYTPPIS